MRSRGLSWLNFHFSANAEEVRYLRIINNRQKERIQELNEEKKRLTVETSQLKAYQWVFSLISA